MTELPADLALDVLVALPQPVLVKDHRARYVWVNEAFERRFGVTGEDVVGQLDADVFPLQQALQCSSGDLRVLRDGGVDEAVEVLDGPDGESEVVARRTRIVQGDGSRYLVGVIIEGDPITLARRR